MSDSEAQPTKQKIEEVEQKVDKLTQKVERRGTAKKAQPAEKMKDQLSDLINEPDETPRNVLRLVIIVGAVLLFALLILALFRSAFIWVAVILLLALILLTGKQV